MARTKGTFKLCDLERAVKGVRNAGLPVLRSEITQEGRIVLIHSEAVQPDHASTEMDQWMRDNAL